MDQAAVDKLYTGDQAKEKELQLQKGISPDALFLIDTLSKKEVPV